MADGPTSGEVNIILSLLKENRDDTKEILKQQAVMTATLTQHVQRLATGDDKLHGLDTRITKMESKCKIRHDEVSTDYPPTPAPVRKKASDLETEPIRKKSVKLDPSLWIKIGLLIGGVAAGYFAATVAQATP
jgi:hypothetical protein